MMLFSVFEYLFCLLDIVLIYYFLENLFGLKKNVTKTMSFFVVFTFSLIIYFFSIANLFFLPNILIFFLLDIFLLILFSGKFKIKFLYVLLYNFMVLFTEIITFNLFLFFIDVDITETFTKIGLQRTLIGIFSKIILYFSLYIIKQNIVSNDTKLPQKFTNYIYSIYIIFIISMISIFKFSLDLNSNQDSSFVLLVICFGFIFIILLVNKVFEQLNKYFILIEQNTFIKTNQNSYDRYFKSLDTKNKENNKFVHDINNHLLNIKSLITNNNSKDAITYISEVISDYSTISTTTSNSGNEIIDIVINQKQIEASSYGIVINTNITLSEKINISDMHLSSLLFNALDNAISETKILESENKQILLNIYERKNYLYIEVRNNVTDINNSIYKAKNKITSKINKKNHGYGILIIEDIIKKYNGYLDFKIIENYFTIIIVLQI